MTAPETPQRRLPPNPSLEYLRKEAKRLAKSSGLPLARAQHRLATEYGHSNWKALASAVENAARSGPDKANPVVAAATRGDKPALESLLAQTGSEQCDNASLNQALLAACSSEAGVEMRMAMVEMLLRAGASPRWNDDSGRTAIHVAAKHGPLALVELLIRNGAFSWQADKKGRRPLHYARRGSAPDKRDIAELLDRPVIRDPHFRAAVDAIHAGDAATLRTLLDAHPSLLRERALEPDCYPQDYFRDPKLFWFVANNPTLMNRVPSNIADLARLMIARSVEQRDLDYTLELAMSSDGAAWADHQPGLLEALVDAGAKATPSAILVVLAHKCFPPVELMLDRGMAITLPIAAAFGRMTEVAHLLPEATAQERQDAFGLAVITGEREAARLCLEAGADVNAALPVHRHSVALHQAAIDEDIEMLKLLVARGARRDIPDTLWNATPLDWAVHNSKTAAAAYLRSVG